MEMIQTKVNTDSIENLVQEGEVENVQSEDISADTVECDME